MTKYRKDAMDSGWQRIVFEGNDAVVLDPEDLETLERRIKNLEEAGDLLHAVIQGLCSGLNFTTPRVTEVLSRWDKLRIAGTEHE
jgi:hypothetical protein